MYIIIYSFIIGCVYEICDQMFQDHIQKPFRHASRNCNSVDLGFEVCEVLEMSYSFVHRRDLDRRNLCESMRC